MGAAATGTHGSGKHSLAHYVQSVRIARYDATTGEPVIEEIDSGPQLRAARCGLGCLGIITQIRLAIRPAYRVEEHLRRHATLESVLDEETRYDLQQFFFLPWRWDFFGQHRVEVARPRSWTAPLYRLYWSVGMDVNFHVIILTLIRWLPTWCLKAFFRHVMDWLVPQGWKVVDRSQHQLSTQHQLFRHIETELFVTREHLKSALAFVELTLRHAAGETVTLEAGIRARLDPELLTLWDRAKGCYVHHYPICIRRTLADDTLISMSQGEQRYAISLISYAVPTKRDGFFQVMELLTRSLARLVQARPHWGKHCPLPAAEFDALYPHLPEFRRLARASDPAAQFTNDWLKPILGGPVN